ncbi:MAG TPA: phosphoribosylanthranilate isomerase, partial [Candidatus Limnocylindrales bacterium]|nr:phosphoribosylanthranilate isomerase [Candidatus Limnocylindrales bacterium]
MVAVKICGIVTLDDALAAAEAGADLLGLNFYRKSPRFVEPETAAAIAKGLRAELGADCPLLVGLFVNEAVGVISRTMEQVGFKVAQLSGDESPELLRELRGTAYKGIRPRTPAEAAEDAALFGALGPADDHLPSLLVDAYHPALYGGTGESASADVFATAVALRVMLAGGLTPENVAQRLA